MKLFSRKFVCRNLQQSVENIFSQQSVNLVSYTLKCLLVFILAANIQVFAQQPKNKVVLISVDGAPDYLIDNFLKNGVLPPNGAFAKMKQYGAYAKTVLPVNVASTGPSHISIFTGASPGKTSIVGNSFRSTDQSWNSPNKNAFEHPILAETIFQAAKRQGKRVITLGGVGLDDSDTSRMTAYQYMYPKTSGPSLVMDLIGGDTLIEGPANKLYKKLKISSSSLSTALFELSNGQKIPLYIYLTDSAHNDSNILRKTTQIIIDMDSTLANGYDAAISEESWAEMIVQTNGKRYISSFTILNEDVKAGKYRLLMTAPAEVFGYPADFLEKIESNIGLWPGEPENRKQTLGLVSEKIWFEQIDRLAKYFRDLILIGMKEQNWDMLFGYFSTLDDVQHRYTLTDPRQLDYPADDGNRPKIYSAYIETWFKTIDRYLLEIMEAAPDGTDFIICSDHGMVPIHTTLLLNNYLEKSGSYLSKDLVKSTTSGNSAHIYINKKIIKPTDYEGYIRSLKKKLKSLKDRTTGKRIFNLVANQHDQKKYGLYHQNNSGDIFVSCNPGYSISDRFIPGEDFLVKNSFDPALFAEQTQAIKNFLLTGTMNETGRAVHGNIAKVRQAQAIFYAIGKNVPKKRLSRISALQIAATISKLLMINPPEDAERKSAF